MCTACPQPSKITAPVLLIEPLTSAACPLLLSSLSVLSWFSETGVLCIRDAILVASAANLVSRPPATNCTGTGRLGNMLQSGLAMPGEASLNTAARPSASAAAPRVLTRSENLHHTITSSEGKCWQKRPCGHLPLPNLLPAASLCVSDCNAP